MKIFPAYLFFVALNFSALSLLHAGPLHTDETTHSDEHVILDGIVGLGFLGAFNMSKIDKDEDGKNLRNYLKISFNRLSKNFALDFRLGNGLEYTDLGGSAKFFKHWPLFGSPYSSSGISLGGNFGGLYSGGIKGAFSTLDIEEADKSRPFWDFFAGPFAQILWDFGNGFGIALEAEYTFFFERQFLDSKSKGFYEELNPNDFNKIRQRFHAGISLVIEV